MRILTHACCPTVTLEGSPSTLTATAAALHKCFCPNLAPGPTFAGQAVRKSMLNAAQSQGHMSAH